MNAFIFFLTSSTEVLIFAGLILIAALCAFLFWYRPAVRDVVGGLMGISAALSQEPKAWLKSVERVRAVLKTHPNLASTWLETEDRIVELSLKGELKAVMFGSPKDLWNPAALLSRRFNFGLAEAVPNILVGVGLFFTFVFLLYCL